MHFAQVSGHLTDKLDKLEPIRGPELRGLCQEEALPGSVLCQEGGVSFGVGCETVDVVVFFLFSGARRGAADCAGPRWPAQYQAQLPPPVGQTSTKPLSSASLQRPLTKKCGEPPTEAMLPARTVRPTSIPQHHGARAGADGCRCPVAQRQLQQSLPCPFSKVRRNDDFRLWPMA